MPHNIIQAMIAEVTKLTDGNRVVIPTAIRKSLGLRVGDIVTLVLQNNDEVRLLTQAEAVRQAQPWFAANTHEPQSGRRVISRTSRGSRFTVRFQ